MKLLLTDKLILCNGCNGFFQCITYCLGGDDMIFRKEQSFALFQRVQIDLNLIEDKIQNFKDLFDGIHTWIHSTLLLILLLIININ